MITCLRSERWLLITLHVNNNPRFITNFLTCITFLLWHFIYFQSCLQCLQCMKLIPLVLWMKAEAKYLRCKCKQASTPSHLFFLPNMGCNRMPRCPFAIPHYPAFLRPACWGCGGETGVRLAWDQATVIDRSMIDGYSWFASSAFDCCWVWHFSPCKRALRWKKA